jgi:hypothetical protein
MLFGGWNRTANGMEDTVGGSRRMIRPSKDGSKLYFVPPDKSKEQELEFDLVYAHICPKCNNLVQALFMTNKRIDPKPWEEIFTKQLDSEGKYKRIIPGRHERFRSRYSIATLGRGSSVSAELIRFTEHFDRKEDVINTPICNFVAISSVIPEYRVYDILVNAMMDPLKFSVKDSDYEGIKHALLTQYTGPDQYAFEDAIGKGPECVFMSRTAYQWYLQQAMGKFMKAYQNPVQSTPW